MFSAKAEAVWSCVVASERSSVKGQELQVSRQWLVQACQIT